MNEPHNQLSADIVERLRVWPAGYGEDTLSSTTVGRLMKEAADEIEQLRHDIDRHVQIATDILNEPQKVEVQTLRGYAIEAADALKILNGHDSNVNLRARYGERWWEQIERIECGLRSSSLTRPK